MQKFRKYQKNLAKEGISQEQQEKLFNARVLVMGAGSLGSNVIMNLAALGVGQIKIIDGEVVKETDFNRQLLHKYKSIGRAKVISAKDWIQEFNSDIKVELDKTKLHELNYFNTIQNYDIIVDCFDTNEAKYMLNEIAIRHNKILVHGGVRGFKGQVTTIIPNQTGCLSCAIQRPRFFKNEDFAILSPVASVISSIQAQEVFKLIIGEGDLLLNKILAFDGLKSEFKTLTFSKKENCETCSGQLMF